MKSIKTIGLIIFTIVITSAFTTPVDLELKSLLNNKVQLKIPKDFTIMPEEMIKVKYPSQSRPAWYTLTNQEV
ncbi:hypothetical protein ACLI1A_05065 [Flavobacterium sp. RHBU_3]|uniref:hypothetical protein n=1 Tax=Flavobacterium sp. RHBU_3 TaxID=3391184 RepID=UPI0039855104